jgi:uncharacterized protein (TIGR01777 family)
MRVAVSGTSGLIGGTLARALRADGTTVLSIGRKLSSDIQLVPSGGVIDPKVFAGLDAVVHLAGAPIARRWTKARRRAIFESRVESTMRIAEAMASAASRPAVLVCGSAVGVYGSRGDDVLTESSPAGSGFLADVVQAWEAATTRARDAGVRVVNLRTGVVLSADGGALPLMLTPFRLGLGGPVGDGRQWMSWISLHDLVRAIRFLLASDLRGPVNAVAPGAVTNAEFARTLGGVLSRPAFFRVPAIALRAVFGTMAVETLLASQRAVPDRLLAAGFAFDEPALAGALRRELGV